MDQQLMQQVHEMQLKLKKEKQQLNQMQIQLTKDQGKVKDSRKKCDKLRQSCDRDRIQLDKERQAHKKKEDELKSERSRLKKWEEDLASDKKTVDHDRSQLKRELKKFEREKERLEEEKRKMEQERKKTRAERDRLKKDVLKANTAKERLEKERQKADQEVCSAQKRRDKLLNEIQKAIAEEEKKTKELKEIEKTKTQLKAELEQLKKEKRKMEKRRSKSPAIKQQAQKQSSSDEASVVSGLRKKLNELEIENKKLKLKAKVEGGFPRTAEGLGTGFNQNNPVLGESWPAKMSSPAPNQQQQSERGFSLYPFSQNTWLRSTKGMLAGGKGARNVPSFSTNLGRRPQTWTSIPGLKEPAPNSRNMSGFMGGGPPGFQSAVPSKPVGGLMFAQTGKKVMARYSGDKQWYDAEIMDIVIHGGQGPKYIVKFKGYPGKEEISANDIRPKEENVPGVAGNEPMHTNGHSQNIPIAQHPARRGQSQWPNVVKTERPGVWGES
eukprot:CAMPEP_0167759000 /NCGR_PEP_ID=MMETSP0110_2-20121227/10783_1 /TAXON_ID=629695 /ORGANISM="Gymnochlora sp., Strain CCMP2014" /LENGTH=495 /DNA_ID=CAMNT_0007645343 /DNA_START=1 /DNA_END=1488 /DNA_ORIENTATION=+